MEFLLAPYSTLFHRPKLNGFLQGQEISIFEDPKEKKMTQIFLNFEELGVNFSKGTKVEKPRVTPGVIAYYCTSVIQTTNKET